MDEVLISVDPHKASSTLAVLDPLTRTAIDGARFANTKEGYRELMRFAARWRHRRWAVEGCHGAGRSLAQRLVVDGERVVDVPAKLAARVRVFSQGHGKKTDRDDAVSIGLAALDANGLHDVVLDDATVTLRLLSDRREELVALRTQAICRLHRLLAELTPGGVRRELTATKAAAVLARLRPRDEPGRVRRLLAMDHLGDVRSLDRRIKTVGTQIAEAVAATSTTLVGIFGVGPVIAARILAEVGNAARFPDKRPLRQLQRHRTHRRVLRRTATPPPLTRREPPHHALHMAAVTQLRNPTSAGRDYYERKLAAGKTRKEALRCLKRRLSDVVFRQLVIDLERPASMTS
jgi:transposase